MKQSIIKLFTVCLGVVFAMGCAKEPSFNYPEGTVGSSKIVYFPSVQITGDRLIIMDQGGTYTDPGVEAKLNGQDVQYTTTGTVDPATPGIYDLVYSASSPDGYSASDWRTVVVMSSGTQIETNDFSGTYKRHNPDNGVASTWTKTGRGVYNVDNPGGAAVGAGFVVVAVNYEGDKIAIPHQQAFDPSINGLNTISSNSEQYNKGDAPINYQWALTAGGYGTQLRFFVKQ
ncbi:MAG: hypothetical protein C5B52_17895 [Bacteroidetes bacterium]|nr:MAG: hypothetical protein C5B52_17895 [Bacteroidota bacterium]